MDETMIGQLIADHFAVAGKDEVAAAEIFADDAVIEWRDGLLRRAIRSTRMPFLLGRDYE